AAKTTLRKQPHGDTENLQTPFAACHASGGSIPVDSFLSFQKGFPVVESKCLLTIAPQTKSRGQRFRENRRAIFSQLFSEFRRMEGLFADKGANQWTQLPETGRTIQINQ